MTPKVRTKSTKEQKLDAELGLIIDEMGRAMWHADKEFIATHNPPLTPNMNTALWKFQTYCMRFYGKKA